MKSLLKIYFLFFILFVPHFLGASIFIHGGLTHEKEYDVGTTYKGIIEVENRYDKPQEVKVYMTDYEFFADGKVIYGEAGKLSRSNANWISINPKRLFIPPKEVVPVYYSVSVPDDTTLSGTYWCIIMLEPIAEGSAESSTAKEDADITLGINQVLRYGIQIITHISDTGQRKIKFVNPVFKQEGGEKTLSIDIENRGDLWVVPDVWVELYDEIGVFVGKFAASKKRIFPGLSARFNIKFTDMPSQKYKALIIADCSEDDIFGMNLTLLVK